jgi:hypothetical protein
MTGVDAIWSVKVRVEDIPEIGAHFDLEADEATRAQLAQAAGLRALPRFTATFDLTRISPDRLQVVGEISATVGQNCIVTLDPVENEVHEAVDLIFAADVAPTIADAQGEATVALSDEQEPPEPLVEGVVDLGAIATEFLLLGIDPYPRRPGAVFEPRVAGDPAAHPFAALAALKKDGGGKSG